MAALHEHLRQPAGEATLALGVPALDAVVGPISDGSLVVLLGGAAARSLSMRCGQAALVGRKRVMFLTARGHVQHLIWEVVSGFSLLPFDDLVAGHLSEERLPHAHRALEDLRLRRPYFGWARNLTASDAENVITRNKEVDVCFIHGATELLSGDNEAPPGVILKDIACRHDIAIIATADRARWDARHSLNHAAPSTAFAPDIDADADVVLHATRLPLFDGQPVGEAELEIEVEAAPGLFQPRTLFVPDAARRNESLGSVWNAHAR